MQNRPLDYVFGRWLFLLLFTTAGVVLGPVDTARAQGEQKQVLTLYTTRRDSQIGVLGDRDLPRLLEQGLPQGLDYYSEYIDRARFPDPDYQADFLRLKYKDQKFDLVIAMSDLAFDVIGRIRHDVFRDTPVVFFSNSPEVHRVANSTGLIADLAISGTVAMAAELQPDLRQ